MYHLESVYKVLHVNYYLTNVREKKIYICIYIAAY